ncbi:spermine transporter [Saccharomycopsis crataegensis]|uniref:Spermine transporter n=1 Tax=Saccharomycopsis crataegensis TaxID=43959 RepID=A0AAV5QSI1_9ASCO|nr:spermine transporter [Saccharomycopsis crataegensis]
MSSNSKDSTYSKSISSVVDENDNDNVNPQPYIPEENEDAQSELSRYISRASSNNNKIKLMRTETAKSLRSAGLSSDPKTPDVNAPTNVNNPIFPEEYTMETETGLVPVASLHDMGRTSSRLTRTRTAHLTRQDVDDLADDEDEDSIEKKTPGSELDPEIEFVTFLTNDPENPHNWSNFRRWSYTFTLSILVIAVAFGSACTTGGLALIDEHYHVSTEVSILTVSLMVFGFSVGPLIWAPLSEQIGRRPVYFISLFLYTIFQIPCAMSPNIGGLLACRFLCGVFASSGLTLVGGSIADMFPQETRGLGISFFAFCPYSGPVFGPLISGWINVGTEGHDLVWRYRLLFWVNMCFAGLTWITSSLVPETYAPVILKKKAQRLRKETGNEKIMTEQEAQGLSLKEVIQNCLLRPLYFVITEPVLDLMCFYVCLIYALLYAFFFAYPVIFSELYGYNDGITGLMFIAILIGALFALCTTPILEKQYIAMTKRRTPTPEDRLIGAMIGSPFPVIALFILGATSHKGIIWVGPCSSGLAFGYGMVLIYYSINNYIIDTYALYSASALATKVFLRSAGGGAFPLFTTQMYHKLGLLWASFLLAFISLAMVAIPFTFYRYGATLRAKLCKENYASPQ